MSRYMPRLSLSAEYLSAHIKTVALFTSAWWTDTHLLARHATFNLLNSKSDTLAKYEGRLP